MFAATGSTITQATRPIELGDDVVGSDGRRRDGCARDAGRSRQSERRHSAPAGGQQSV